MSFQTCRYFVKYSFKYGVHYILYMIVNSRVLSRKFHG